MLDCDAPVGEARAAQIVAGIASDAALMGELRYWMSTMRVAALIGRDRVASATALKARLAAASKGV